MAQSGRYDILRELGRGGMGVVYLALDTLLKRQVAIKTVLRPQGQEEQEWQDVARRLIREAQAAAGLKHANIVGVYDLTQDGDSTSIVMEYVKGTTLAETVRPGSQFLPAFAIGVLKQCAGALDYAHSQGIVHRDIKPANIMLDEAGSVKIADFGVAKVLDTTSDLTHGLVIGTLEYMSPEQLDGRRVDGATDQYSLAVVAYQMLTGHRIFEAETAGEWCWQIVQAEPLPASQRNAGLPRTLDAVLARAMAKNPAARYSSCSQFLTELERASTPPARHNAQEETTETFPPPPVAMAKLPSHGGPVPGTVKVNPKDGLKYVWIPPGKFRMGCSPRDMDCFEDESPAHEVTLTKGFWVGQTEVTQEAYQRVMGKHPSRFKGASLPVETVSWDEAQTYCKAVGMRLPTQAEWEYAARGGNASSRYGELEEIAWFSGNSGNRTHDVAQKQPNAYGLYDMLGNVWEWVEDWYGAYEPGQRSDPTGPATGTNRTLRGGSWGSNGGYARVSSRRKDVPGYRSNDIGLRCVGD